MDNINQKLNECKFKMVIRRLRPQNDPYMFRNWIWQLTMKFKKRAGNKTRAGTDAPTRLRLVPPPTKFPAMSDDGALGVSEPSKHGFMRFW